MSRPSEKNWRTLHTDSYGGSILFDPERSRVVFRVKSFSGGKARNIKEIKNVDEAEIQIMLPSWVEWL